LQNESADALRRLARRLARKGVAQIGVMFLKTPAQLEAAGRNLAQAAPLPRGDLEYFRDPLLRRSIPFPANRAAVLVFDLVAAFFQLGCRHQNAFENVERLKAGDDDWDFVALRDGEIFLEAHDGADVACSQESLNHAIFG
jgi:hypothetical protein